MRRAQTRYNGVRKPSTALTWTALDTTEHLEGWSSLVQTANALPVVLLLAGMLAAGFVASPADAQPQSPLPGSDTAFAPNDPPGQWLRPNRDYASTRYSPLAAIDTANVAKLRLAWSFSDGALGGHEAAPLVDGDTLYLVTPYPNVAYALDLSKPGAPIKWAYQPKPTPTAIGKACCGPVNRGAALAGGKLIFNLLDDHTVAVDTETGQERWRTKMGDVTQGETLTMAPLAVSGAVYIGNSGGRFGVRGWLAALDEKDGHQLWRAYSTGPDADVRIGKDFKPFYSRLADPGPDLGTTSWPAGMWQKGAGAVSGGLSYDPTSKLVFYGTGSPGPRVPAQRPGANLWTSAVLARDADLGMAGWAFQFTPHDWFGYGGENENVLLDLTIAGQPRHVLVQLNQNGFAYVIDRATGEVLKATPFANQNWARGIDPQTATPLPIADKEPRIGVEMKDVCPADVGAKGTAPSAFSPQTGLLYAGIFNVCMDVTDHPQAHIAGTPYDGMEIHYHAGPGGNWGEFMAWDPVAGKKVWSIKEEFMASGGALATAGHLVFYGTADGWFRAADAKDGKLLWSQKLGSGISAPPIAFLGPDQREYVAIVAGVGGAAMANQSVQGFPARGGTLYVFSIDGESVHEAASGNAQ